MTNVPRFGSKSRQAYDFQRFWDKKRRLDAQTFLPYIGYFDHCCKSVRRYGNASPTSSVDLVLTHLNSNKLLSDRWFLLRALVWEVALAAVAYIFVTTVAFASSDWQRFPHYHNRWVRTWIEAPLGIGIHLSHALPAVRYRRS